MAQQLKDKRNDDRSLPAESAVAMVYNKFSIMAEKFAETRLGQTVIELADRVLMIVEETTKWSLPQGNDDVKLMRPLPWLLFLTLIIWLRALRFCASICAIMVGYQTITPQLFVFFIQNQRQKLHAKRQLAESESVKIIINERKLSLKERLSLILSYAICRPGYINEETPTTLEVLSNDDLAISDVSASTEQVECLSSETETLDSDKNLTVNEMLEKYGNRNTDVDDPDFVVSSQDWKKADNTSTSISEEDTELEITEEELKDLKNLAQTTPLMPFQSQTNNHQDNNKEAIRENGSNSNISTPKFFIEEYSGTASSNPSTNDTYWTNNKEIIEKNSSCNMLKGEIMADEQLKYTPGHETAAESKLLYLNTTTPLTVPPNIAYYPSYEKVLSNFTCSHGLVVAAESALIIDFNSTTTTPTTTTILTNASSSEDLYYSPIGSPALHNYCILHENPPDEEIFFSTSNGTSAEVSAAIKPVTGDTISNKKPYSKPSNNHNSSKNHCHKSRARHHY